MKAILVLQGALQPVHLEPPGRWIDRLLIFHVWRGVTAHGIHFALFEEREPDVIVRHDYCILEELTVVPV